MNHLLLTCGMCPTQYEFTGKDGVKYYFRHRWGHGYISTLEDVFTPLMEWNFHCRDHGSHYDGFMEHEMAVELIRQFEETL